MEQQSAEYLKIAKEVKELTAEKQKLASKLRGLEMQSKNLKRGRVVIERTYQNRSSEHDYLTEKNDNDEFQRDEYERLLKEEEDSLQLLASMSHTYEETLLDLETQSQDVIRWIEIIETIQMEMDLALYECDQDHAVTHDFIHGQIQLHREIRNKIQLLKKDIDIVSNGNKNLQKQELGSKKCINEVKASLQKVGERKGLEQEIMLKVKNVKSSIKEIVDDLTLKVQDQDKKAIEQKQELITDMEKLKSRIHELQIEVFTENLRAQNNEKKVTSSGLDLSNLQQKMMKLEVEIEKNNSNLLIEKEELHRKINELETIKVEMESKFTKEIESIKGDHAAQEVLKVQLQNVQEENKVKIDEQQKYLQLSEEEVLNEKNEKDELNRQYCEVEATFKNQNQEMDHLIKELENNLVETETEQEGGEKTLKLEIEEFQVETGELENTVGDLKDKLELLNLECQKHKEMVNVPVDDFQQEIEQMEKDGQLQIEKLTEKKQELESAMVARESVSLEKTEQLISDLENLKVENDGVHELIAKSKEKLETLKSELERYQQVTLVEAILEKKAVEVEYDNLQYDDDEMESLPIEIEKKLEDVKGDKGNLTKEINQLSEQLEKLNTNNQKLVEEMKTLVEGAENCRTKLFEVEDDLRQKEEKCNELFLSTEKYKKEFKSEKKQKERLLDEVELAIDELTTFLAEQTRAVQENLKAAKNMEAQLEKKLRGIVDQIQFVKRKKTALEINIQECTKEINSLELHYQGEKNALAELDD